MRVTNSMMFDSYTSNMQSSLSKLMEYIEQGSTQKQINKPSDDPVGAAFILNARVELAAISQYESNIEAATSWLDITDDTLSQVSTTIIEIKTLAEQAATDTMTDENRDQIAVQLTELLGQLLNLSNTQNGSYSIFAGHNYDESAYDQVLTASSEDPNLGDNALSISGASDETMAVRFLSDGTVGSDDISYEWSNDGGSTWTSGTLAATENAIVMNGVTMTIRQGTEITGATDLENVNTDDGSFVYIYNSAEYNGDDNDSEAYPTITDGGVSGLQADIKGTLDSNVLFELTSEADLNVAGSIVEYRTSTDGGDTWTNESYTIPSPATGAVELPFDDGSDGTAYLELDLSAASTSVLSSDLAIDMQPRRVDMLGGTTDIALNAQGVFANNTIIRLDNDVDLSVDGSIVNYSYSTDGGSTWITASSIVNGTEESARLSLPSGYLDISSANGNTVLEANSQMLIHPDRADLEYEIMQDTYVAVNQVGSEIFGGEYNGETVEDPNLFDIVGKLIAYCEFNDSEGISESLEALTAAQENILTSQAAVGGLSNRLTLASDVLTSSYISQTTLLSNVEDIDLTELLINMEMQELAYTTVLQSSSMVMNLGLINYL